VNDENPEPSREIVGTVLLSSEALDVNRSLLHFGYSAEAGPQLVAEITIEQEPVETAEEELPPDPSGERVADGPTGAPTPQEEAL
jgi:hypothetical protein